MALGPGLAADKGKHPPASGYSPQAPAAAPADPAVTSGYPESHFSEAVVYLLGPEDTGFTQARGAAL